MVVKIFGGIDLIIGLILIFGAGVVLPSQMMVFFGMVLIGKSLLGFFQDFASWIDFFMGIVILISSIFHLPAILSVIFGILLLQKGAFSFL